MNQFIKVNLVAVFGLFLLVGCGANSGGGSSSPLPSAPTSVESSLLTVASNMYNFSDESNDIKGSIRLTSSSDGLIALTRAESKFQFLQLQGLFNNFNTSSNCLSNVVVSALNKGELESGTISFNQCVFTSESAFTANININLPNLNVSVPVSGNVETPLSVSQFKTTLATFESNDPEVYFGGFETDGSIGIQGFDFEDNQLRGHSKSLGIGVVLNNVANGESIALDFSGGDFNGYSSNGVTGSIQASMIDSTSLNMSINLETSYEKSSQLFGLSVKNSTFDLPESADVSVSASNCGTILAANVTNLDSIESNATLTSSICSVKLTFDRVNEQGESIESSIDTMLVVQYSLIKLDPKVLKIQYVQGNPSYDGNLMAIAESLSQNNQESMTFTNGIEAADYLCNAYYGSPGSTYKAMIADGTNRVACTSANCASGGNSEHINWVIMPNTVYNAFGNESYTISDANGLLEMPTNVSLITAFNQQNQVYSLTGLNANWTTGATCSGWTTNSSSNNGSVGLMNAYELPDGGYGNLTESQYSGTNAFCDIDNNKLGGLICVEQYTN